MENTTKEQNYNTQLDLSTYNSSGYKVTLNPNYDGGANTVLTQTHKSWSKDGFGTLSGNIYTYGAGNGKVTENYNDVTLTTPDTSRLYICWMVYRFRTKK